jgi:hypothetical protein
MRDWTRCSSSDSCVVDRGTGIHVALLSIDDFKVEALIEQFRSVSAFNRLPNNRLTGQITHREPFSINNKSLMRIEARRTSLVGLSCGSDLHFIISSVPIPENGNLGREPLL